MYSLMVTHAYIRQYFKFTIINITTGLSEIRDNNPPFRFLKYSSSFALASSGDTFFKSFIFYLLKISTRMCFPRINFFSESILFKNLCAEHSPYIRIFSYVYFLW